MKWFRLFPQKLSSRILTYPWTMRDLWKFSTLYKPVERIVHHTQLCTKSGGNDLLSFSQGGLPHRQYHSKDGPPEYLKGAFAQVINNFGKKCQTIHLKWAAHQQEPKAWLFLFLLIPTIMLSTIGTTERYKQIIHLVLPRRLVPLSLPPAPSNRCTWPVETPKTIYVANFNR